MESLAVRACLIAVLLVVTIFTYKLYFEFVVEIAPEETLLIQHLTATSSMMIIAFLIYLVVWSFK